LSRLKHSHIATHKYTWTSPDWKTYSQVSRDLKEMGYEGVNWIQLAQDRNQWQAVVNMAVIVEFHRL